MKISVNPAVKTQQLLGVAVSNGISLELAKKTHSDNIDRCIQNLELVEMGQYILATVEIEEQLTELILEFKND